MDRRFLSYYENELQFMRDLGGEFARTHEAVAGKLGLDAFACADPYVERLLEGVAFLTARVQLKLDAEFPTFTNHLLEMVYPDYLAPTPAMALVQLQPDPLAGALEDGYLVPRGTRLNSRLGPHMQTRCTFTTAQDVTLWPLAIDAVDYVTGTALTALGLARRGEVRAALQVRLKSTGELPLQRLATDELAICLRSHRNANHLFEAIIGHGRGLVCQPPGSEPPWRHVQGREAIFRHGLEDDQAMLPGSRRGFEGHRLLREYFAFPGRFLSVRLAGLAPAMRRCEGDVLDLFILLDGADAALQDSIEPDDLALHVTPAVNLFERHCEPVQLDEATRDHHVIVDRVRPLDYEIHSLVSVEADGKAGAQTFRPFYGMAGGGAHAEDHAWYTIERRPRVPSSKDRRRGAGRSSYVGGEVFIDLGDASHPPWREDLRRLHVRALCTNRDLPMFMPLPVGESHFTTETGAPVARIVCLGEPTRPRPSLAHGEPARGRAGQGFGETPWRLISQLALNHVSLVDVDPAHGEDGAAALRELVRLYADFAEPAIARQVDGIRKIASRPVVDRVPSGGPITFGRGIEIDLTLEEALFEGGSAFLFGAIIEQFMRRQVSINSFTRTNILSLERGEIMRWPARIGRRHLL